MDRLSKKWLMAGALSLGLCGAAHADVLYATPDQADAGIWGAGTNNPAGTVWRPERARLDVGYNGSNYYNTVLVFSLPALPSGHVVESANLKFYVASVGPTADNGVGLDVYGLDYRAASSVLAGDWYSGGALDANATLIQSGIATKASAASFVETDAAADLDLGAYLQAQYDAGAVAGDYVFLRLNTDVSSVIQYFSIATADAGIYAPDTTVDATHRPELMIVTAVPEPASLGLLALGGLCVLARRR